MKLMHFKLIPVFFSSGKNLMFFYILSTNPIKGGEKWTSLPIDWLCWTSIQPGLVNMASYQQAFSRHSKEIGPKSLTKRYSSPTQIAHCSFLLWISDSIKNMCNRRHLCLSSDRTNSQGYFGISDVYIPLNIAIVDPTYISNGSEISAPQNFCFSCQFKYTKSWITELYYSTCSNDI